MTPRRSQQATTVLSSAIAAAELRLADSGALEGLLTSRTSFFGATAPQHRSLLADGTHLEDAARAQNLGGDQWGIMNETGNYPGQPWLWLYSLWYQVPPFSTSDNADIGVWALMILLNIGFVCIPWIPGLRTLPRHLGSIGSRGARSGDDRRPAVCSRRRARVRAGPVCGARSGEVDSQVGGADDARVVAQLGGDDRGAQVSSGRNSSASLQTPPPTTNRSGEKQVLDGGCSSAAAARPTRSQERSSRSLAADAARVSASCAVDLEVAELGVGHEHAVVDAARVPMPVPSVVRMTRPVDALAPRRTCISARPAASASLTKWHLAADRARSRRASASVPIQVWSMLAAERTTPA